MDESTFCIWVLRHSCVCTPLCLSHVGEGAWGTTLAHGTSVISAVTVLPSSLQAGVGRKPGHQPFLLHAQGRSIQMQVMGRGGRGAPRAWGSGHSPSRDLHVAVPVGTSAGGWYTGPWPYTLRQQPAAPPSPMDPCPWRKSQRGL